MEPKLIESFIEPLRGQYNLSQVAMNWFYGCQPKSYCTSVIIKNYQLACNLLHTKDEHEKMAIIFVKWVYDTQHAFAVSKIMKFLTVLLYRLLLTVVVISDAYGLFIPNKLHLWNTVLHSVCQISGALESIKQGSTWYISWCGWHSTRYYLHDRANVSQMFGSVYCPDFLTLHS